MNPFSEQVQGVKDRLRAAIFRGELAAGSLVREEDLRRESGASVRAVRQALTDLSREGLIDRRRHVGTFVGKKRLAGKESGLPRISAHVGEAPALNLEGQAADIQGVIALEANHQAFLDGLVRAGRCVVAVDFCSARMTFDAVAVDHQEAGRQATEHLLAVGHRRIAFVGEGPNPHSSDPTWQDRLTGYLRAMAGAGGETPSAWILNIRREANRIAQLLPEFHERRRPTAYVACGGQIAENILQVLNARGCRCPREVSVVACDGELHKAAGMQLSCVRVDYEEFGRSAVLLLAARLTCRQMPPVRVTLPVEFKPGDTSGPAVAQATSG